MNKVLLLLSMIYGMSSAMASEDKVSDFLMSQNKLIAVNAILLMILSGIVFYLFTQDRKIKNIEKQLKD
ncbi:MAG TPA: hypothetical protein VLZ75_01470 [Chitinophagales bacterium]|nr:hypothetical protein [Chitinophagales bacterium]